MTNRQRYIQNLIKEKKVEKEAHGVTPQVYAAFALTLSYEDGKYKWTPEQIEELFVETQALWEDCVKSDVDMCEWCYQVTGIDVRERK